MKTINEEDNDSISLGYSNDMYFWSGCSHAQGEIKKLFFWK